MKKLSLLLVIVAQSFLVFSFFGKQPHPEYTEGFKDHHPATFSGPEEHPSIIPDADLVAVRLRWAGQENRISQLKFEAEHYAKPRPCDYFCDGLGYVASLDATTKTVTTFFNDERQPVKLSYEQFSEMFRNQRIVDLANAELKKQATGKSGK